MKDNKSAAQRAAGDDFEAKARRIDRFIIGLIVNVYVSILTTLFILWKMGVL